MDYWTLPTKLADTLAPGETVIGHDIKNDACVPCTVLRFPEPCKDQFGRSMIRVWGRRDDTGDEGYIGMYGPGGIVRIPEVSD